RRGDVAWRARRRAADARGARRWRPAVVRRARGAAVRGVVGGGRGTRARRVPPRGVRVADAAQRATRAGAALRRAVPVHRLVRGTAAERRAGGPDGPGGTAGTGGTSGAGGPRRLRRARACRAWRARARADRAGVHRVARPAAAGVPGARGAVRGPAAASGAVRAWILPRHRDRADGGARAGAVLPVRHFSATAPPRVVRGRLRRGDRAAGAAGVPGGAVPGPPGVRLPGAVPVVQRGERRPAVARRRLRRAGRRAAGGRARRAGRPAVSAG